MAAPTVEATPPTSVITALRTPNFALLWSAQVVSGFGDKITLFALAFVTWQLTGSALVTTFAVVVTTVPYAAFGFFGGAIADALGLRRSMIACDVIRVVAIGAIPVTLALGAPLAIAYVLVFLSALCSAVFNPARVAIVPDLLPREHLGAGNSMVYASDRTVEVVGAVIAGVLVALLGSSAFYVDALTFALSALLLVRISKPEPPPRAISWSRLLRDAGDGLETIRHIPILWANTVFSLVAQLSIPVLNGLLPVLVFREFGMGPEQLGVADAAIAVGAVGAGLVLPSVLGQVRKGQLLIAGFAGLGISLIALGLVRDFPIALLLLVLAGVMNVLFFVPNVTIAQELAPVALRGRVFGARMALLNLTWLPVVLALGMAADVVGVHVLLALAGALTLGTAIVGSLFPSIRDVP